MLDAPPEFEIGASTPQRTCHEDPALDNDEGEPSAHSISIGGLSFDTTRQTVRKAGNVGGSTVSTPETW